MSQDESIVEVIARTVRPQGLLQTPKEWGVDVLAALRDAGYEMYRPGDCVLAEIRNGDPFPIDGPIHLYDPEGMHRYVRCGVVAGSYRLVPIEGDSS